MTDILFRSAAPELKAGRYRSIIQENKDLRLAVASSDGSYLFSEAGAGVQPLVFVGTLLQISKYLAANENRRIVSTIRELPNLYAGLDAFKPKEPFKEVFSLGTVATQVTRSLLDFFPSGSGLGGAIADLLNGGLSLGDLVKRIATNTVLLDAVEKEDKRRSKLYILRVSYLPEDGLKQVATGEIRFGTLLARFG